MPTNENVYKYYNTANRYNPYGQVDILLPNGDTCVVSIQDYIYGYTTFPCGSGDDYELSNTDITEIEKFIKD